MQADVAEPGLRDAAGAGGEESEGVEGYEGKKVRVHCLVGLVGFVLADEGMIGAR